MVGWKGQDPMQDGGIEEAGFECPRGCLVRLLVAGGCCGATAWTTAAGTSLLVITPKVVTMKLII